MRRHVQMYNVALCLDIKSDDKQMIMEGKRSIVCLLKSGEKNQIRKAVKCEEKIPKKLILAIEVKSIIVQHVRIYCTIFPFLAHQAESHF